MNNNNKASNDNNNVAGISNGRIKKCWVCGDKASGKCSIH